jgi:hypothetical protein
MNKTGWERRRERTWHEDVAARELRTCDRIMAREEVEPLPIHIGYIKHFRVTWLQRIAEKSCNGGLLYRYRRSWDERSTSLCSLPTWTTFSSSRELTKPLAITNMELVWIILCGFLLAIDMNMVIANEMLCLLSYRKYRKSFLLICYMWNLLPFNWRCCL